MICLYFLSCCLFSLLCLFLIHHFPQHHIWLNILNNIYSLNSQSCSYLSSVKSWIVKLNTHPVLKTHERFLILDKFSCISKYVKYEIKYHYGITQWKSSHCGDRKKLYNNEIYVSCVLDISFTYDILHILRLFNLLSLKYFIIVN